jgi:hypothetical protein
VGSRILDCIIGTKDAVAGKSAEKWKKTKLFGMKKIH